MTAVAVVDYGMSNLDSVVRALQECGADPFVAQAPAELERAARIVLPGVGSFADGMENLRARGFEQALREHVQAKQIPCLGICLGMQLLLGRGTEGGDVAGLGFIPGAVLRLEPGPARERIPHVGWNEVEHPGSGLFAGLAARRDFYFVHSYVAVPDAPEHVLARTPYCGSFASAVARDNVYGVQFHPEKSQKAGFRILRNFLEL
jgi:imidazole glycerol-phosphate synthase subunit HisH